MLRTVFSQQLIRPTQSISGWLTTNSFKWHNLVLEENAVKLCDIQPDDVVLEVGHGPGWGLQAAAQLLTGHGGKLHGVDYSKYMHGMSKRRMSEQITKGKVNLYHANVAAMPLEESSIDKVFHCNSYYYWPELKRATSELHRVMKPGAVMVTTLIVDKVVLFASKKLVLGENWRPEAYMDTLHSSGFTHVRLEDRSDKSVTFQAIFATATK